MLPVTAMKRLEALATISTQGKPINGLFRLVETPVLWHAAYANIYANAGALTVGTDSVTLDGFSEERVIAMITRLKTGTYRPQPTRRTYVPKANGKKRPLGISEGNDKLLQEVVRTILEKIYEPIFAESSHGFRPGRSPHTALEGIKQAWQAVKWLVDMDLRSYFQAKSSTPRTRTARVTGAGNCMRWRSKVDGVVAMPVRSACRVPICPPATNPSDCTSAMSRGVIRA
jgi:Reverse transcriptase (RNA-dependent DNA polymerase)